MFNCPGPFLFFYTFVFSYPMKLNQVFTFQVIRCFSLHAFLQELFRLIWCAVNLGNAPDAPAAPSVLRRSRACSSAASEGVFGS